MNSDNNVFANRFARIAGVSYLVIIAAGIFGQVFARNQIIVVGDIEATVANLMANPGLWRLGIANDLLMHACDIPVIVFLYWLLSQVHRPLALIALVSNVLQTAVAIANKINLVFPLLLSTAPDLSASDLHLIDAFINAHNHGFSIALIFFGISCLIYANLLYRSQLIAKGFCIGIGLAGVGYLLNSMALLLIPSISGYVMILFVVCLAGELAFGLRLTFGRIDLYRSPFFHPLT